MIDLLIQNITYRITSNLKYYKKTFGICELITKDGKEFPAQYFKKEFIKVTDFDKNIGTLWFRVNGNVKSSQIEDEAIDYLIEKSYPIRLISVVKKDAIIDCNDNYIDLFIADNIEKAITGSYSKFAKNNRIELVYVNVNSTNVNRTSIFASELKSETLKFPFEYSIIAMDLNCVIRNYNDCTTYKSC